MDNELIVDGNAVYEIDKQCQKQLSNNRAGKIFITENMRIKDYNKKMWLLMAMFIILKNKS